MEHTFQFSCRGLLGSTRDARLRVRGFVAGCVVGGARHQASAKLITIRRDEGGVERMGDGWAFMGPCLGDRYARRALCVPAARFHHPESGPHSPPDCVQKGPPRIHPTTLAPMESWMRVFG